MLHRSRATTEAGGTTRTPTTAVLQQQPFRTAGDVVPAAFAPIPAKSQCLQSTLPFGATARGVHQLAEDRAEIHDLRQTGQAQRAAFVLPSSSRMAREKQGLGQEPRSTLRNVLISCLVKELLQRLQTISSTEAGRAPLRKAAGWTNAGDHWIYEQWCHRPKKLVPDPTRNPMQHDNAVRLLSDLRNGLTGDVVQRFKAKQQLQVMQEKGWQTATFSLEISVRGQQAQEVHQAFLDLVNSSLMHLIGSSLKSESGQQIADTVFRGALQSWHVECKHQRRNPINST